MGLRCVICSFEFNIHRQKYKNRKANAKSEAINECSKLISVKVSKDLVHDEILMCLRINNPKYMPWILWLNNQEYMIHEPKSKCKKN